MCRYRSWFLVSWLVLSPGMAVEALDPEKAITQYSHRLWQDQLPQSTVHTITQTGDGYLWLGTYEGLVRFDGIRFVVFDSVRSGDLPGTTVFSMAADREARLWVGTSGGLVAVEDGRFRALEPLSETVRAVHVAADGSLFVVGSNSLARVVNDRVESLLPADKTDLGLVEAVDVDGDGALWIATDDGLMRWTGDGATHFGLDQGLPHPHCRSVLATSDGSLWVGTNRGLARWNAGRFEAAYVEVLGEERVTALLEDRDGNLWVGTEEGLFRRSGGGWNLFGESDGLSHDHVRSLFEDREGAIWIGTSGGLDQLRDGKFTIIAGREGLNDVFVRSVYEDRDGTIWIGTDGSGVDLLRDGEWSYLDSDDGLSNDSVLAILQSKDGAVWLGTRSGLSRVDGRQVTSMDALAAAGVRTVRTLFEDDDGSLWIGTEGDGLFRYHQGEVERLTTEDGLAGNDVRALLRARDGCLWAATHGGLSCIRDSGIDNLTTADGLSVNIVFELYEDDDGNLWIGTDNGLNLRRHGEITVYSIDVGLFDNKVFRILEDDRENLWMSSNRGLSRASKADLLAFADGEIDRIETVGYTTADGMPANQVNGTSQPAGWRDRSGSLWFPTTRGVVVVDPNDIETNPLAPPVHIEEVVIDDEAVEFSKVSTVEAGARRFEFHYTALSFQAPEKVQLRYRLDGFDLDWVDSEGRRTAYYTNIPPGEYTFRVIGSNNDGLWNETGASYRFVLETAAWRTWWAILFYAVAVVGTIAAGVRWRLHRLAYQNVVLEAKVRMRTAEIDEKSAVLAHKVGELEVSENRALESQRRALEANRAKTVFLSNMSHELRTPLTSIIGFAAVLHDRLAGDLEPKYERFLENILASGKHLLGLINDLLDLSKIEAGRMTVSVESFAVEPALLGIRNVMRGVAQERQIEIALEVPEGMPELEADLIKFKQVMFNLLSNAIKFSADGSTVIVRAGTIDPRRESPFEEGVRVDVVDHGVGISEPQLENIFEAFKQVEAEADGRFEGTGLGLSLVKHLVEIQGGFVTVSSEPGRGSTFSVFLPLVVSPVLRAKTK